MAATVKVTGPFFDGRAAAAMVDYMAEVERVVADAGIDNLRDGTSVFRYEGGKRTSWAPWRSRLESKRQTIGIRVMNPAIYTPWLEGTSRMNQLTSFKGYHLFRNAAQDLNLRAVEIAGRVFRAFAGRMQ